MADLLRERYDAYRDQVREDLVSPLFGNLDRLIVLADLLTPLHARANELRRRAGGLASGVRGVAVALLLDRGRGGVAALRRPPSVIRRVAYAATKADHVASRQRGNLARADGGAGPHGW